MAGYKVLAGLPEEKFDDLMRALSGPRPHVDGDDLLNVLMNVGALAAKDARALLFVLLRLNDQEPGAGPGPDAVVEAVYPLGGNSESTDLRNILRARLDVARKSGAISTFGRATLLLTRNERNYSYARTVTDLRPVFSDDVTAAPLAYVVVHDLEIVYQELETSRGFTVALDERDIDDLISALERSKQKAETLKTQLQQMHMPYLTTNR